MRLRTAGAAAAALLGLSLLAVAPAEATPTAPGEAAGTVWLCRPGLTTDPCTGSLRTTDLASGRVWTPRRAAHRPVDCFYLYPTVSTQPTMTADLTIDAAQVSIAQYQASRFSRTCRVFAPMYRQVTLAGLGGVASARDWRTSYRSARSGWRDYLRRYNDGRGVVLIGHSQGAYMLRQLISREIDRNPAVRRRLVGAVLPGTSVAVPRGRLVGGDFRHVPGCSGRGQVGCVQSWATYNRLTPPRDTYFGRLDRSDSPSPKKDYEALCTEPARIAGQPPRYRGLKPSAPPASPFNAGLAIMFSGDVPTAATPWVAPAGRYAGHCQRRAGAHYLQLRSLGDAPVLNPAPDLDWGLHILDINGALPQLTTGVAAQIRAYTQAHGS